MNREKFDALTIKLLEDIINQLKDKAPAVGLENLKINKMVEKLDKLKLLYASIDRE